MTCHRTAHTGGQVDSTITDHANAVRPFLLSDIIERRHVGVMVRTTADREGRLYAGEVLCDLTGGRVLVQLLGSTIAYWAQQSSTARLVVAEA